MDEGARPVENVQGRRLDVAIDQMRCREAANEFVERLDK